MSANLDTLRKTAEAATPGPWEAEPYTHGPLEYGRVRITSPSDEYAWNLAEEVLPANAEFIATFNPETVLALLSRLEQAEQAVQRVRAMAQDWTANGNSCAVGDRSADVWHATANAILRALDGDGRRLADDALGGGQDG